MDYKYDYLVFIGRFQPWHEGHEDVLKTALKLARNVIVLVGSSNRHISVENPWTYEQREEMISGSFHFKNVEQDIFVCPLNDYPNDTAWVMAVENTLRGIINEKNRSKIGLIGYDKDSTSYYLRMFPTWEVEQIKVQYGTINSTQIREQYFQRAPVISEFVPNSVRSYLKAFALKPEFKWLLDEFEYHREYKRMWANSPFPPFFVTVDPVVVQSGNILLVTRKEPPYKGALALPGGFVKENELLVNAAIRELREETKISDDKGEIPPAMLKSFIAGHSYFDDPKRSQRGRAITHAFLFDLPKKGSLYKVIGSDDAEKADWYSLASLKTSEFMEDHAFIIQDMLGIEF
jgi:bifunctional NMN adenylyltransferase/nudix hydrolase